MSTGARELRPMFSFNPSEPAILHDRNTDNAASCLLAL
jgi:hypothetical protein